MPHPQTNAEYTCVVYQTLLVYNYHNKSDANRELDVEMYCWIQIENANSYRVFLVAQEMLGPALARMCSEGTNAAKSRHV